MLLGLIALTAAGSATASVQAQILVYDENSVNQHALRAAERVRPGEVTRAVASDFNALLASQEWEVVVLDLPSTLPLGGMGDLTAYVNDGGLAVLSTWFAVYDGGLFDAFGADGGASISFGPVSMDSTGTATADAVFAGVPMPWFDWQDNWGSDGAAFILQPGSEGLATISSAADPIMVIANDGRTIAAPVLDEMDGSTEAELIWENMMNVVLSSVEPCRADIDGDGALTLFDFLAFQNAFDAGARLADFDGDGSLTLFDFLAFQNEFDAGCE
jgi:hypothetical protein